MPTAETDAQPGRTTKVCSGCGVSKPATPEFFPKSSYVKKDGTRSLTRKCRECRNQYFRAYSREQRYGLTPEEYDRMLEEQGNACAICGSECASGNNLAVDHDHETGEVRGLLCYPCNTSLGRLGDDVESIRRVLRYLEGADG